MYKFIFIDLDGTLLNDKKEISEENIKWLNRAYKEKGITSIITTGRLLGYVEKLYSRYNCSFGDIIIASNGAIIKNIKTKEYINKEVLTNEEMKYLRSIYLEENLEYIMIYTEKEIFREGEDKTSLETDKIYVENIEEFLNSYPETLSTICILSGQEKELNKAIKRIELYKNLDYSPISEYIQKGKDFEIRAKYIDVMKKGVNKKNAIKKVMDTFGVNHDEIIVIGDGGNDLQMFEYAKLKIAMENGSDALKQKADYITDTNNNDGVAKAIKKLIFNE